jgi:hypothetical protein
MIIQGLTYHEALEVIDKLKELNVYSNICSGGLRVDDESARENVKKVLEDYPDGQIKDGHASESMALRLASIALRRSQKME